jgi:predicted DNA-binding transcriptional regulator AlpA
MEDSKRMTEPTTLSNETIDTLAEALWQRIVGAHCDPIEMNLRAKLALEQRMLGSTSIPFGLDKLSTAETAAYIGCEPETLRDKTKRKALGIPVPYAMGRKLHWRRSELDVWIEQHRGRETS